MCKYWYNCIFIFGYILHNILFCYYVIIHWHGHYWLFFRQNCRTLSKMLNDPGWRLDWYMYDNVRWILISKHSIMDSWDIWRYCTCTIHWLLWKFKNLFVIMQLYPNSWYTLQYYEWKFSFTLKTFMEIIYVYFSELWKQTFYWVKFDKR
jgi:hypothetical protein